MLPSKVNFSEKQLYIYNQKLNYAWNKRDLNSSQEKYKERLVDFNFSDLHKKNRPEKILNLKTYLIPNLNYLDATYSYQEALKLI